MSALVRSVADAAVGSPQDDLAAGLEALRREEYARAAVLLEAAEAADPRDPRPATYLSGTYLALARPGEAEAAVDRALTLDPHGFGPRLKAGELAMRFGDIERAETQFLAALRAAATGSPDFEVARRWLAIARERLRRSISRRAVLPRLSGPLRRWTRAFSKSAPAGRPATAPTTLGQLIASASEEDHR
jgi:tetratricopeptide (TPR) repeat protein